MKRVYKVLLFVVFLIIGYYIYCFIKEKATDYGHKVVVCIPVYGQSLALGEEAIRVTDLEKLKTDYDGRILTENLDYDFGYFEPNYWKKCIKKLLRYQKRSFELSVYGMAESLANELGKDTVICIFPGGQGATPIKELSKGTNPYNIFLYNIQTAYKKSKERGWEFYVPAICWMQGESDIVNYPTTNYKALLKQFSIDINQDIKKITHQDVPVRLISYQTNAVTRGKMFDAYHYDCKEVTVPQALMELIRDDSLFWPSGPIYTYSYVREAIHIDGNSQKHLGKLEAKSALRIIRNQQHLYGLMPLLPPIIEGNDIIIRFDIPCPPITIDTTNVKKIGNYGFNVITHDEKDIISSVTLKDTLIKITCSHSPIGCKLRYAINGEKMISGKLRGPRGNIRDACHNWCYQFEFLLLDNKTNQ